MFTLFELIFSILKLNRQLILKYAAKLGTLDLNLQSILY
jgi:hypothetical protein